MRTRRAVEYLLEILEKQSREQTEEKSTSLQSVHTCCRAHQRANGLEKDAPPPQQPYCPHNKLDPHWYPQSVLSCNVQA